MISQARISVHGIVQGVGFRYFAYSLARSMGLKGYVRNESDGSVLIEVSGERRLIEDFIAETRKGPRSGHVDRIDVHWTEKPSDFTHFEIR